MVYFCKKQFRTVFLISVVLLHIVVLSKGQTVNEPFDIDDNVLLNLDSSTSSALKVWKNYLSSKGNIDSLRKYWSEEERAFFGDKWVDARYRYLDYSSIRNVHNFYKPFILGIEQDTRDKIVINNLYYHCFKDTDKLLVPYVYTINVLREHGKFVLESTLFSNIKTSRVIKLNTLDVYKFGHNNRYNGNSIAALDSINNSIARIYGCLPLTIKVIIAESAKKLMQITGYSYERTMYYSNQSNAFSEPVNKLVFVAGDDENFVHELCHLYTHFIYSPNLSDATYHNFIDEGVSTLFGGSVGIPLKIHLKKIYNFDKKQPIDFTNVASLRGGVDNKTFYNCCIGGMLCKIMYDREGMNGVAKLLKSGTSDESLYKAIDNILGVKRENINDFIHNELKKYAQ